MKAVYMVFLALALFAMAAASPQRVILNPVDPAFGRPTYERPDISPVFAPNRPGKVFADPNLRGGK